jgi:hypothetical protein
MRPFPFRVCSVVAVAGPVLLGVLALPAPSSGAASLVAPTTCRSLHGSSAATTASLGRCTRATTGGSGTIAGVGPNTDLVTWKNSGTTSFTYTHQLVTHGRCAKGSNEYRWTGTVTASTGPASGITGTVTALVCVTTDATAKATLLKGTRWTF